MTPMNNPFQVTNFFEQNYATNNNWACTVSGNINILT